MQKIVPHLWYDKEALEAAKLYVSLFDQSSIMNTVTIPDTPSGDAELVEFRLANLDFSAISAGPYFTFNPSASLMVACETKEEVDRLYKALSPGGSELMPLYEYPFSKHYVWLQDKYGLGWQLMLVEDITEHPKIRPCLLFSGPACGYTEAAADYYTSVFRDVKKGYFNHYAPSEAVDQRAKVNYGEVDILGTPLVVMDHGYGADFTFNEAFSFEVLCNDQKEIDYYWDRLSAVPEAEQCGWLKDKYGLSWQIVPAAMKEMMSQGTKEEIKRITEAFLKMKKFDITALEKARVGQEC
jgi:predicted 3-demethylubiquinone-9 3-methyltransferase (glyoxalase superfamily)